MRVVDCIRRSGIRRVAAGAVLGLWAGCLPRAPIPEVAAGAGQLLEVEVGYVREAGAPLRLEAEAHFVRYRVDAVGDRDAVAGLLGIDDGAAVPVGGCVADDGAPHPSASALEVALLDAGPLTIRAPSSDGEGDRDDAMTTHAVIEPQRYPEIMPFVSGVVYGVDAALARPVVPGAHVELTAAGGEDLPPFTVAGPLPAAFPDLSVAPAADGSVELRWAAPVAGATVQLELRWNGARPGAVRCRAADEGRFVVGRALLAGLGDALERGDGVQATASRSERSPFEIPGIGTGWLTLSLQDLVAAGARTR